MLVWKLQKQVLDERLVGDDCVLMMQDQLDEAQVAVKEANEAAKAAIARLEDRKLTFPP